MGDVNLEIKLQNLDEKVDAIDIDPEEIAALYVAINSVDNKIVELTEEIEPKVGEISKNNSTMPSGKIKYSKNGNLVTINVDGRITANRKQEAYIATNNPYPPTDLIRDTAIGPATGDNMEMYEIAIMPNGNIRAYPYFYNHTTDMIYFNITYII